MTIREIAHAASVSTGTVDRVIHKRGYVSAEKRALIEKIIRETGFRPNMHAQNLKLNRITRIAFLTPLLSSENGYWKCVYAGVKKAQEDLMDLSVVIDTYEYDRSHSGSFTKAAEKMWQTNPDGCVVIPKCPDEARDFINNHLNLKFVLLDSALSGVVPLCTISQNFFRGGFLAGRLISLLQPNAKRILTFSFMNSFASKERIRGFKKYFAGKKIEDLNINSRESLQIVCRQYFKEMGPVDAIFSPCSMGFILGDELVNLGMKEHTVVLTYDLLPENRRALLCGTIDCVLSQRPIYQGYSGIYQIYRALVQKQSIEKEIDIQIDILFQENVPQDYDETRIGKLNSYCVPSVLYN